MSNAHPRCVMQLWTMGRGTAVWRIAPDLYYRMISEVIRRAVAAHGLPPHADFDAKLVRTLSKVATAPDRGPDGDASS